MSLFASLSRLPLAASVLLSGGVLANPSCPILTCSENESYAIQVGLAGDECENGLHRCTSSRTSPPGGRLDCLPAAEGHVCEAWPQGDGLVYVWAATGGLALLEPAIAAPQQIAACQPGAGGQQVLAVEIVSPFGLATSAQMVLDCP